MNIKYTFVCWYRLQSQSPEILPRELRELWVGLRSCIPLDVPLHDKIEQVRFGKQKR